jgi:hypothetical protein
MNLKSLGIILFISLSTVGCASTPTFELNGQETFDRATLAGNWMCSIEKSSKAGGNELYSSLVSQEYYGEDGAYIASGSTDFQVNGEELGSIFLYVEGSWIANESELMTKGERVKILALPGSNKQIARMANSQQLNKSLKETGRDRYDIVDETCLRTNVKNGIESTCITWNKWQRECSEDCGELLDADKREFVRKRFFPDA